MSNLLHELNEEMREQKLKAFWAENKTFIIGAIVTAIILTAAVSFWRHYQAQVNTAHTAAMVRLVGEQDLAAIDAYAAETRTVHGALAGLTAAGMHMQRGETEAALARYDDIAKARKVDAIYRDLAVLLAATVRMDGADAARAQADFEKLDNDKNAWRHSARLNLALMAGQRGDTDAAAGYLARIIGDDTAPADMRAQAEALRSVVAAGGNMR